MDPQQLIRRPLITEKSTRLKEGANTICFEVAREANKIEIAKAVTALFGVGHSFGATHPILLLGAGRVQRRRRGLHGSRGGAA